MATARVFKSGNSQAVRLPKDRLRGKQVEIFRRGEELVLREMKGRGLERAFELLAKMPIDVDAVEEARKEPPQSREDL